MARTLGVIGVPSSAGAYAPGQEKAPRALRAAGLLTALTAAGVTVVDHGDAPVWRWRPDREQPYAQNLAAVVACAIDTAERVRSALAAGEVALVLGGDCTVGLGTRRRQRPRRAGGSGSSTSTSTAISTPRTACPTARSTGWASRTCSESRTRRASCASSVRACRCSTTIRSCCSHTTRCTARPTRSRRSSAAASRACPREDVAADPAAAAQTALSALGACDRLAVHFDVDCIDFTDAPLSENTGRNAGLSQDDAFAALAEVLRDPRVGALTITELNPEHGAEDGSTVAGFSERLVAALAGSAV